MPTKPRRKTVRKTPTFKQQRFAEKYVELNGNGAQAALETYEPKDYNSAKGIARDNIRNPVVQEAIEKELNKTGLTIDYLNHKSKRIVDEITEEGQILNSKTLGIATNHLQFLYKLHNVIPANKNVSMNLSVHQELTNVNVDVAQKNLKDIAYSTDALLKDLKS